MKKPTAIRWTVNRIALEFQRGTKAVSSALKAASIRPGSDGKFSTVQVAEALFDSEHTQRVRLLTAQAKAKEFENQQADGQLVPVADFANRLRVPLQAMRKRILDDDEMSHAGKNGLLSDLQQLYGAVFGDKVIRPRAKAAMKAAEDEEK